MSRKPPSEMFLRDLAGRYYVKDLPIQGALDYIYLSKKQPWYAAAVRKFLSYYREVATPEQILRLEIYLMEEEEHAGKSEAVRA